MHITCWEEVCYEGLTYKSKLPSKFFINVIWKNRPIYINKGA